MTIRKTEGLVAAPFTPLRADGAINLDMVEPYAHWLHRNRVVGAFVCGTTGEGMSLTVDERRQLAERWVATAPAGLRVIVHVGHTSLADCRALAAHAESIGADSIACLAPFFFRPAGVEGLVTWCEQVAAAAPKLPFYYYHMPSMTGVSVKVSEFLGFAGKRIPSLAGVKFTFEDLDDFRRSLEIEDGRFDLLFGRDELLLSALKLGARGAVGSTYNYAAPIFHALIASHQQGDEARAGQLQALAVRMIDAFLECGAQPVAAFKWFMNQTAIECGPVRLPLVAPTPDQIAALETKLEASGIFEWIARRPSTTVVA
ncbi:MAG: dihydrodipicolinate synthetase [Planctomycetes bacterium]|nr:dihydrodipicolinate synthetase [Planctomycetota bacterium]